MMPCNVQQTVALETEFAHAFPFDQGVHPVLSGIFQRDFFGLLARCASDQGFQVGGGAVEIGIRSVAERFGADQVHFRAAYDERIAVSVESVVVLFVFVIDIIFHAGVHFVSVRIVVITFINRVVMQQPLADIVGVVELRQQLGRRQGFWRIRGIVEFAYRR